MESLELRQKFLDFFKKNGHTIVPSSSLLPTDPSVLLTTAGMQQFKPYYADEKSPFGNNAVSCQKCFRTSDIEEVGDERHLTFFEMLGNFSFGGYFKKEAITLAKEFLDSVNIKIDYVTVFEGDKEVPADDESKKIWEGLGFSEKNGNLKFCGRPDNFWGPTGEEGPCGPTTEIYSDGIEIWNIVFNEYYSKDKKLEKLSKPGIDTGMGLERLAMVSQRKKTIFETDLFEPIINEISKIGGFSNRKERIIADHARAIFFLISDGLRPSNKEAGYILRRLMRRVIAYEYLTKKEFLSDLLKEIFNQYKGAYPELKNEAIVEEFSKEKEKFKETIELGVSEYLKLKTIDAKSAFFLYQSFGLPFDAIKELDSEKSKDLKYEDFEKELNKHKELSRTASAGMFKGGLADAGAETTRLHTAAHLMLAALRKVLGQEVFQKGSNITAERLRFDFSYGQKMTPDHIKQVEELVNRAIQDKLVVEWKEESTDEARAEGAMGVFGEKYGDKVKVYTVFNGKTGEVFSKEICGGPHVKNTSELRKFKIVKEESSSAGVRRIKAVLE